jgi:hypothetical protein
MLVCARSAGRVLRWLYDIIVVAVIVTDNGATPISSGL